MVAPRLGVGKSDPVSYVCECGSKDGLVLLFYRYFANSPALPGGTPSVEATKELTKWHEETTKRLSISGKIRIAQEGFNVTVGGTKEAIESYISACIHHWSFKGLQLSTPEEQKAFFKPSSGCSCVFQPAIASVRLCAEITPLGITNYAPSSWDSVEELLPEEFHRRCLEEDVELLDFRNHYESRIGYFVDASGKQAVLPQIRRFSQLPRLLKNGGSTGKKQVLTYCTGGIRCEKATRWMAERDQRKICTLKGGIQAYLDWMEVEIDAGRMKEEDSLFRGKNYVFDARGTVGLPGAQPVSQCHICASPEDRLSKCSTDGCHLVLVVCEDCDEDVRCCEDCRTKDNKEMCMCEQARESKLWVNEEAKPKTQGWRKARRKEFDIQYKVVET